MKTIIKSAIVALSLIAGTSASQAQPGTPWLHFPYKGAPYATQSAPVQQAAPLQVVRTANTAAVRVRVAKNIQVVR